MAMSGSLIDNVMMSIEGTDELIALLDILVIGRFIPPIRELAVLPQLADHLMFGAVAGACFRFLRRRQNS